MHKIIFTILTLMSFYIKADHREMHSIKVEPKGYALESSIWPTNTIPVCWVNPDVVTDKYRNLVPVAITRTWEQNSAVRFVGWDRCPTINNKKQIRIYIEDTTPHVKALGKNITSYNQGMVLNFTFRRWNSRTCGNQGRIADCIRFIAIHEFGHALGFAHEQNRPDTPRSCNDAPQGTSGDVMIGSWDLYSIMNYCNPEWMNRGRLSVNDIKTVQTYYYEGRDESIVEIEEPDTEEDNLDPEQPIVEKDTIIFTDVGDINGDKKLDMLSFGKKGITTRLGIDNGFVDIANLYPIFSDNLNLDMNKALHTITDINNDNQDDIVIFFDQGVYAVTYDNGELISSGLILEKFGNAKGWGSKEKPRYLTDINGDGNLDIVGFNLDTPIIAIGDGMGSFESE